MDLNYHGVGDKQSAVDEDDAPPPKATAKVEDNEEDDQITKYESPDSHDFEYLSTLVHHPHGHHDSDVHIKPVVIIGGPDATHEHTKPSTIHETNHNIEIRK